MPKFTSFEAHPLHANEGIPACVIRCIRSGEDRHRTFPQCWLRHEIRSFSLSRRLSPLGRMASEYAPHTHLDYV